MKPSRLVNRTRALSILPLLALATAACVQPDAPGVKVNPISAKLVFGVKETAPSTKTPIDQLDDVSFDTGEEFTLGPSLDLPDVVLPPDNKPAEFCPSAPPSAAVEKPTEVDITGKPLEGAARWKRDGIATLEGGQRATLPRTYEGRIVRNFRDVPADIDPRFTAGDKVTEFEMIQPIIGAQNQFLLTTYQVRTTDLQNRPSAPAGPVQPPTVGQAERGVVLKRIATVDKNFTTIGTPFEPTTGLLLLPLPVTSGESFQSSAVDPKSGRTIAIDAVVGARSRIDACGDLVDGWQVDTTWRDSRSDTVDNLKYSMVIATQFGGQIVAERFTLPASTGGSVVPGSPENMAIFELGQLKPTPVR